jgi:hypothetical protein
MGNTSQLDDPKSEPQHEPSADDANGDGVAERVDAAASDDVKRPQPTNEGTEIPIRAIPNRASAKSSPSLPPSDAKPVSRRSSLRPAPASFKPSTRDPSQLLRPAMVVHAGDVDADVPLWDVSEPASSQPSQAAWDAPRPEPFALANDLSPNGLPAMVAPPADANAPVADAPVASGAQKEPTAATAATVTVSDNYAPSVKSKRPQRAGRNTLSHFGAPNRQSKPHVAQANAPSGEPPLPSESPSSPPGKRLSNTHFAAIAAAVLLAGVIVAMMVGRTNLSATSELNALTARSDQVLPAEALPSLASTPLVASAAVAASTDPAENAAVATQDTQSKAVAPSPSSTAAPASSSDAATADSTRVTLEVVPADARVVHQGRLQPPPYEFDVPKGKKIALELARFGFVTQKVVLDGKKPVVKIGLRRVPNLRGAIN